mgnify:CR=1 FL=1
MLWLAIGGTSFVFLVITVALYLLRRGDPDDEEWQVSDEMLSWLRRQRENQRGGA